MRGKGRGTGERGVMLIDFVARSCFGLVRIWRMSILTICRYEGEEGGGITGREDMGGKTGQGITCIGRGASVDMRRRSIIWKGNLELKKNARNSIRVV